MDKLRLELLVALIAFGCVSPPDTQPESTDRETQLSVLQERRPRSYEQLRKLTDGPPRHGDLVVTPKTLQLDIRRGHQSSPFIELSRKAFDVGCWKEPPRYESEGLEEWSSSDWWIFSTEEEAVALEFTAYDVGAWFWDEERGCPLRVPALDGITFDDATPDQYYQADDAQIAYLFNYTSTDRATSETKYEVDGVREADVLDDVAGPEQFIVERGEIAVVSDDGRALLQVRIDDDDTMPCHNTQLTLFEQLDGGIYAVASFETFGDESGCNATRTADRFTNRIAEWRSDRARFETTFEITEESRERSPKSYDVRRAIRRQYDVAGGRLTVRTKATSSSAERTDEVCLERDGSSGVCLRSEECWEYAADDERVTSYRLVSDSGVTFEVGEAKSGQRELADGCEEP